MARQTISRRKAQIFVTKVEVARRQINAAIRMVLANEDQLAIHTVAFAGYKILRGLLEKKGRYDAEEVFMEGLYLWGKDIAKSTKTLDDFGKQISSEDGLKPVILWIANEITKQGDRFTAKDIPGKLSAKPKLYDLGKISKALNFLKRVDMDHTQALNLTDADIRRLITRTIVAYLRLSIPPTDEMKVYWLLYDSVKLDGGSSLGN
jgi:hypothetical protein